MPRGSKPGERRGGRQRGTPNKTTALKNAVLGAAAAKPNASPLDFMLGLMRDPNVPTDLRLEMAVAAAPFFHAKPQAPPRVRTNAMGSSPIKSSPDFTQPKMEEELKAAERPGENDGADVSPLQFLLQVMNDPDATPRQRIKAARVAARYKHVPAPPDKQPGVDEYGFAISRTLADAIKEDWLALDGLGVSSKEAPRRAEILFRQAKRDEYLRCPSSYSPEADEKRLRDLVPYRQPRKLSKAEETELAFVMARLTASKAAFNRSPEGQLQRRMDDLQYKRSVANNERNRRVGLTREEGKELDELLKRRLGSPIFRIEDEPKGPQAAAGVMLAPDSEMEELAPTVWELMEQQKAREEELIERRKAEGHPDPWDGKAPTKTIHDLERRRYLDEELTPEEKEELQELAGLYPDAVEKMRVLVQRRYCGTKRGQEWLARHGRL
jgi:hypothetical protein